MSSRQPSFLFLFCAALVAGCDQNDPPGLEAYGTIEVHEADVAAPVPARVVRILVDEGDSVSAGDTLALLTQTDLDATLAAYRARVGTAEAQLRDLEAGARQQEVGRAQAELAAATAEADRTAEDLKRIRALAQADLASRQALDNAEAAARVAAQRAESAREALRLLQAGSRPGTIQAARAEVENAQAQLRAAEARASDLVLTSAVSGRVLLRLAEPGEILGAGVPALRVGETTRPWVRIWVPAHRVERLAAGASVTILLGGREIPGRVTAVNPRAEFTPRVALSEEERADLMFGVKVEPTVNASLLKPGLWVTVRLAPVAAGS